MQKNFSISRWKKFFSVEDGKKIFSINNGKNFFHLEIENTFIGHIITIDDVKKNLNFFQSLDGKYALKIDSI